MKALLLSFLPCCSLSFLTESLLLWKRRGDKWMLQCSTRPVPWRDLSPLSPGTEVWMTDVKAEETVMSPNAALRSYLVEGPQRLMCRNRQHFIPLYSKIHPANQKDQRVLCISTHLLNRPRQHYTDPFTQWVCTRARSGREIVKPQRQDLQSWKKSLILTNQKYYLNVGSFKYWVTLSWVLCNLMRWIFWIWSLNRGML